MAAWVTGEDAGVCWDGTGEDPALQTHRGLGWCCSAAEKTWQLPTFGGGISPRWGSGDVRSHPLPRGMAV